jgi:hypothetical protein
MFPLLSPSLLASVVATREVFYAAVSGQPTSLSDVRDSLVLLVVFDVVAIAGAIGMFGALLDD